MKEEIKLTKQEIEEILLKHDFNLDSDRGETASQLLELFAREKQKAIDNCLKEHSFKCCQILKEEKQKWVEETEYLPTKLRFVIRGIYPESVWKTPPKAKRPHDAGAAYIMRILGANVAKNELEKLLRELKQRTNREKIR